MFKKLSVLFKKQPADFWLLIGYVLFASITFELFNRPFGEVRSLKIPLDDKIPFVKELILVYHTFFFLVILTCLLILLYKPALYRHLLYTLFFAQIAAYVIFVSFQTYVPRYDITKLGDDFFSKMVSYTYRLDNSYSGAPSLHVCNMCISSWFFLKLPVRKSVKVITILYMMLIALTTVLVKQHVFLDIPTGILHAVFSIVVIDLFAKKRLKKSAVQDEF